MRLQRKWGWVRGSDVAALRGSSPSPLGFTPPPPPDSFPLPPLSKLPGVPAERRLVAPFNEHEADLLYKSHPEYPCNHEINCHHNPVLLHITAKYAAPCIKHVFLYVKSIMEAFHWRKIRGLVALTSVVVSAPSWLM